MKKKRKITQKKHKPYPKSKVLADDIYLDIMLGIATSTEQEVWTTIEGENILFKNLRESHIKNILVFMDKRPGWRAEARPYLEAELRRREQKRLIRKTAAGKLFYEK